MVVGWTGELQYIKMVVGWTEGITVYKDDSRMDRGSYFLALSGQTDKVQVDFKMVTIKDGGHPGLT
jgi:hypothetical protein